MQQQENIYTHPNFTLTPVDAQDKGALSYVLSRDGEPLGLVMMYVMEGPGSWYGFMRPSVQHPLGQLAGSPFEDLEAAVRAVRNALTEDSDLMTSEEFVAA